MKFLYSKNLSYISLVFFALCSLFLFTNCSNSEKAIPPPISINCPQNITMQSISSNSTDVVDNDISDFSWSKVAWLNSHDISNWEETSEITSIDVKQNGQICIDHTKKGQWPEASPTGSTSLEGNPYIIAKIEGTYHIAAYEWLEPGDVCKLGSENSLSKTYSGKNSIGAKIGIDPLGTLTLRGGEVVGFVVSGLARNYVTPNAKERSQILWYKLPPADGVSQGEKVGVYSNNGHCCPPPNHLNIVQEVADKTGDLLSTNVQDFTEKVVECLKDVDERWGRRHHDDSNLILNDVVAYRVGEEDTNPYSIDIIQGAGGENPKLQWLKKEQIGGVWLSVSGVCVLDEDDGDDDDNDDDDDDNDDDDDDNDDDDENVIEGVCGDLPNHCSAGDFHNHPKDSETEYLWTCRNRPHVRYKGKREISCRASKSECSKSKLDQGFKFVDGQCVPPCEFFASEVKPPGVRIAKNEECNDIQNYNIAYVNKKTHNAKVCCLRSSKSTCPSRHYYRVQGNCLPSCGNAARLAGWGGYGPDRQPRTNDDTHVFGDAPCANLERFGRSDWKNMPDFYDPYNLRFLNRRDIKEVWEHLGYPNKDCCVRGSRVKPPARMPSFLTNKHPECE